MSNELDSLRSQLKANRSVCGALDMALINFRASFQAKVQRRAFESYMLNELEQINEFGRELHRKIRLIEVSDGILKNTDLDLFKEKYKEDFNKIMDSDSEEFEERIKLFKGYLGFKGDEEPGRIPLEGKNSLIKELIARVEIVENKGLYESIDALAEDIVTLTHRIESIEDEGLYNLAKGLDDLDDDIIALRDRIEMIEDEEYTVRFDNLGKEIKTLHEKIKMLTSNDSLTINIAIRVKALEEMLSSEHNYWKRLDNLVTRRRKENDNRPS